MKLRKAFWAAAAVTVLYVAALFWADSRNRVFDRLPEVAALLPALMAMSLFSYALRYLRWWWLLARIGHKTPFLHGWWAYLSGFAFTATPGKVGELLRIRYFLPLGVPPARVLAVFVFERACDVIAVALLAALAIHDSRYFALLLTFVLGLLAVVAVLATQPRLLGSIAATARKRRMPRLARLLRTLRDGLSGAREWIHPRELLVSLLLGLAAWGISAWAFVWLLGRLGIVLEATAALSLYPTAMLVGAASFLPGGVGATEAVIVVLLALHAVPLGIATLAAVAIRLAGLWFSVACGFVAIAQLERRTGAHKPVPAS
ncbi:flippase-like domain-containing protein [Caenimonas sedimenti]|uniref:Flippase-like domain-containing protein n=1 Tax=Caenimonas sedimenti TaxID=2596921 RepID=A0A562ZPP1_9BURK|nr:lysylphosphatidylglycerol synthase transmembrane domain-containing protein [Caenimonas sedimenti]TWO70552.1 flippase-like domain-containing protein [Caenimonas sedimenti]